MLVSQIVAANEAALEAAGERLSTNFSTANSPCGRYDSRAGRPANWRRDPLIGENRDHLFARSSWRLAAWLNSRKLPALSNWQAAKSRRCRALVAPAIPPNALDRVDPRTCRATLAQSIGPECPHVSGEEWCIGRIIVVGDRQALYPKEGMHQRLKRRAAQASFRAVRCSRPRQRDRRQAYGLAHGGIGTTDCRRRERLGWRLMSKHRLYAEQE
jgi:hypothetical protein